MSSETLDTTDLDGARYISLTTFKRDGTAVSTPVWITGSRGRYAFTTGDNAWKTKRILRNPAIRVQVCNMRGRVRPDSTVHSGTATISTSGTDITSTERSLSVKYGWQFQATKVVDGIKRKFGRGPIQKVVAVHLAVDIHPEP
jgi:uncharacterized protein